MTTSSPELPCCVTELSLGNPAPAAPSRSLCGGGCGGLTATELQAVAILSVARQAAAAEEGASSGDGGVAGLSMRRSMEWFLQRRREARPRHQRGADADDSAAVASPSSSSSLSCLADTVVAESN